VFELAGLSSVFFKFSAVAAERFLTAVAGRSNDIRN